MSNNSTTCPHCESGRVEYRRERISADSTSTGTSINLTKRIGIGGGKRKTKYNYVSKGFCKDCGYTWDTDYQNGKRPVWFWVLATLFFPITLSVLFWKTDKIKLRKPVKGGILAAVWIILFAVYGPDTETHPIDSSPTSIIQEVENITEQVPDKMIVEQENIVVSVEEVTIKSEKEEINEEVYSTQITDEESIEDESDYTVESEEEKTETSTSVEKEPEKPTFTYTAINERRYADINMNVRSLPNLSGEVIGKLAQNEEVKVTGKCNETGWYRIEYKGAEAFASNDHLKTEKVVIAVPVVTPSEQPPSSGDETTNKGSSSNTVTVPEANPNGEHLVWIPTNGGTKYHSRSGCSKMNNPIQVPIEEAEKNGFTPCKRCY